MAWEIVIAILFAGASYVQAKKAQKKAKELTEGVEANIESNSKEIPVVYGKRRVGGVRVYIDTSRDKKHQYLYMVLAMAEGEVESITDIKIDDVSIEDDRFNYDGLLSERNLEFEVFLGSDGQEASTLIGNGVSYDYDRLGEIYNDPFADQHERDAADPNRVLPWSSKHKLSGIAYLALKFKWDEGAYTGIPDVTAVVKGRKVYDPRTSTTAWSDNPALCIRDYLTNERFGKGLPASAIDDVAFSQAANDLDSFIAYPYQDSPEYQYLFRMNHVVDTSKKIMENLNDMIIACRGFIPYSNGVYSLKIDQTSNSVLDIGPDQIISGIAVAGARKEDRFNQVKVNFFNASSNYKEDQAIYPEQNSTLYQQYLAEDEGEPLVDEIDLYSINNYYSAREMARLFLERSRQNMTIAFQGTSELINLEVGEVVSITHPTPAWTNKLFQVQEVSLAFDGTVQITCIEYDAALYTYDTPEKEQPYIGTRLPDPNQVEPPTALSTTTGTYIEADGKAIGYIDLSWSAPEDSLVDRYELKFEYSNREEVIELASTEYRYKPTQDNVSYVISVRAVNGLGIRSAWLTAAAVTAVVDTTAPSDITGINISAGLQAITLDWTNPSEDDFDLVRIKHNTTDTEPDSHSFEVRSDSFVHDIGAYSTTKHYWLAPVDRTGNVGNYVSGGFATTGSIDYSDVGNTPTIPVIPEIATTVYLTLSDSDAPTDAEFSAAVGRDPIENDFVVVSYTVETVTNTKAYVYKTVSPAEVPDWTEVTEYIDGSMIVTGSLSASDITTGTLNANDVTISNLTVTSGQLPSDVVYTSGIEDFVTQTDIDDSIDDSIDDVNATLPVNGLKYYYPLNYINDGRVKESVNGTYVDVLTDATTVYLSSADSVSGKSFEKSGNGGIQIVTDAQSDALEVGGFCYSLWFKSTTTSGHDDARILTRDLSDYFAITVNQTQGFPQDIEFHGEPSSSVVSDAILQDTWHHIVLNSNGTEIDYYLDGVKVVDAIGYAKLATTRSVIIGENSEDGIYFGISPCQGKWTEVRVYDRELTKAEVLGLYKFPSGTNPADQVFEDSIVDFITAGDVNENVTVVDGGKIQAGTAITVGTGDDVAILSGADTTYRLWAGDLTASDAPFSVTKSGVLNATGAIIDGDITATSIDVENATVTGTFIAPIGWGNSVYNGVINRGNLSESVKDLIDERIAEVTGGIEGDFGQDDGGFSYIAQGNPLPDHPLVSNITHENGKNLTIELSGNRSWTRTFIGLPDVDMGVSITIQRASAGSGSWTNLATLTDSGSSITTSTYLVHSGTQGYSISIYHVISEDPASGNYDYRAYVNSAESAYSVTVPLELTVVEPATVGAGNADTLDNQDGTYYLDYTNFTNKPTLITQSDIDTAISNLVDSSPTTLNTLNELASALGDDPNFATTTATSLGNKANKAGDTFTGTITQSYDNTIWSHSEATHRPLSKKTYAEAGSIGTTGSNITDVYGESDLSAIDNDETFTYAQAWDAVETHGGRLPTLAEVMDGVGEGSGQGYDAEYLWTCTPAGAHHVWVVRGDYGLYGDKKIVDITDPLEVYNTRCFFDVSRDGRQLHYSHDGKLYIQNAEVTSDKISNWDTAHGWGNHADAGYLTVESYENLQQLTFNVNQADSSTSSNYNIQGVKYSNGRILAVQNITGYTGNSTEFRWRFRDLGEASPSSQTLMSLTPTAFDSADLDVSGTLTASGYNDANWNTAYTYSQVGHLPLAGGTITGTITKDTTGTIIDAGSTSEVILANHTGNSTAVPFAIQKSGTTLTSSSDYGMLHLDRLNHESTESGAGSNLYFRLKNDSGLPKEYAGVGGEKVTNTTGRLSFYTYGRDRGMTLEEDGFLNLCNSSGAYRFYDDTNTTFIGGIGSGTWGGDSAGDIKVYLAGDNDFAVRTAGVLRTTTNSNGFDLKTGDYKINGTTVIDNLRNISNVPTATITTVNATTANIGTANVSEYIHIDRTNNELGLVFEDSGGHDTIYHTVNDAQGNYNIMLGVNGAGQSPSGGDGQAKLLMTGHGVVGSVSLNAGEKLTNTGDTANYNIGFLVNASDQTLRVGNPNDNVGLDSDSGTKFLDVSRNAFFNSLSVGNSTVIDSARNLKNINSITMSGHFYFDPNGYSIQFDSDGSRDTLGFYRDGELDWLLKHTVNRDLSFTPVTGKSLVFNDVSGGTSDWASGDQAFVTDGYIRCKAIVNYGEDGTGPAGIIFGTADGTAGTYVADNVTLATGGATGLHVNSSQNVSIPNNLDLGTLTFNKDGETGYGSVIKIDHVENNLWVFNFESSTVGNDNDSGFWIGNNGYPDMRLRKDSPTVTALISSWEESFVSNSFNLKGGDYKVDGTTVIDSSKNLINIRSMSTGTSTWSPIVLETDLNSGNPNSGVAIAFDGTDHAEYGYRFKANGANYYQVLYDGASINWKHYDGAYTSKMSLSNGGHLNTIGGYKVNGTAIVDSSRNATFNSLTVSGGNVNIRTQNEENPTDVIYLGTNNGNSAGTSNTVGTGIVFAPQYTNYTKRSAGIMQIGEGNYFRSGLAFYTNGTANATTDWSERMRIDMDGNVLIGQAEVSYTNMDNTSLIGTNSNNKLHVNGSIQLTNNSDAIVFGRGTATFIKDEELGFGWGGGLYMTDGTWLRTRGNKGFYNGTGTIRTDGAFDVGGNTVITSGRNITNINSISASGDLSIFKSESQINLGKNGGPHGINFYDDDNSLKWGFYYRTSPDTITFETGGTSAKLTLDTSGNLTVASNVTAYSDITLKDNIEVIPNALDKVCSVRGVTYDRIDQDNARQTGVIAQEIEQILPEAVQTNDDGIKSVAYGNMVGLLIEAIKEQQAQINELKEELKNANSN